MLAFALFLLVCTVQASEDGTSNDGQNLPCQVISKNGKECFVFDGHCQVSSDVMRRCLNPLGSSSADAADPTLPHAKRSSGVSNERGVFRKRGVPAINLRRLLSVPREQADDDDADADLLERQKRVVYYYDEYSDYAEEVRQECRAYRMNGHVCYWRPVGNNCKRPTIVYARCLNLPDFSSY